MLRFACLLGIAVLAVTAVRLVSSHKSSEEIQPEIGTRPNVGDVPLPRIRNRLSVYPVQFSLN
jgi:hypothetical protein